MNIKKILTRSLLAMTLSACGAAFASPLYHVTLDTTTLGSDTGYLDLVLGNLGTSASATATLDHFVGNFINVGTPDHGGASSGTVAAGDQVLLQTSVYGFNDLLQNVQLGGKFSFDVDIETSTPGDAVTFGVALYGSDASTMLGGLDYLLKVDITPGQADVISPANAYASISTDAVSAVPEPSTLLSMVTGLGLLGFGLRRRAR